MSSRKAAANKEAESYSIPYVEPLSDARTPPGERCVPGQRGFLAASGRAGGIAARGRAGEKTGFFNSLPAVPAMRSIAGRRGVSDFQEP